MKKSLIALAVASALPVAAQADLTISGSVEGKYSSTTWEIESDLDVSVSEVLTNGMTATANVDVSDHQDGNGAAGLSGDFGSMSVGTDSNVQSGADVGDIADQILLVMSHDANTTDETAATQTGLSYSGSFSGFDVALNAGKDANNDTNDYDATTGKLISPTPIQDDYSSLGIAYNFNGLNVGFAQLNTSGLTQSAVGASYSFGDLTVSGGSTNKPGSTKNVTKVKGAYEATFQDLVVKGSVSTESDENNTWDAEATYTMGTIAVTATAEYKVPSALKAVYTSGAITATVEKDAIELDYDMGNADINVKRSGGATTASYKVAF
jgi:hypothetical protein